MLTYPSFYWSSFAPWRCTNITWRPRLCFRWVSFVRAHLAARMNGCWCCGLLDSFSFDDHSSWSDIWTIWHCTLFLVCLCLTSLLALSLAIIVIIPDTYSLFQSTWRILDLRSRGKFITSCFRVSTLRISCVFFDWLDSHWPVLVQFFHLEKNKNVRSIKILRTVISNV